MSLPNRNNPYTFEPFLKVRDNFDYYADDAFLQKVLKHFAGDDFAEVDRAARKTSKKASTKWRNIAEKNARPEERPYLVAYDAYNNRIDRIVRPADTEKMEKEVYHEKMFAEGLSPWERVIKFFTIAQNGEAGVICSLTCTEGMVEVIKRYADTPKLKEILICAQEGKDGHIAVGAQFISEMQSGSDVPDNLLEAVEENGEWRLYGKKFWTSAMMGDYSIVSAKPAGSEKIALFVVPSWIDQEHKEKEIRNNYTIDRLKWKMGTIELPSGEITYKGAVAYPVGELDRGLQNVVGIVLTLSRLTIGLNSAATTRRAVREVRQYADFRETFGKRISQYALVEGQVRKMEHQTERAIAGAFKMYRSYFDLPYGLATGMPKEGTLEERKETFRIRELIMWQKAVASLDATLIIHKTMSIFGGFSAIEDWSAIPRLLRDSAVNELWEGPVNLLLDQIYRDFLRAKDWYTMDEFIKDTLVGIAEEKITFYQKEMNELLGHGTLIGTDDKTIEVADRWYDVAMNFLHDFQEAALLEVNG